MPTSMFVRRPALSNCLPCVLAGLVQSEVLGFGPAELLRLVQLHQQVHLKPSKSCIKYISAVLEQHISAQHAALQQEQQPHVPGSNSASTSSSTLAVMQLVMCLCGLGVWGVRLHLRSVAELLVLLEAHKQQLPLAVVLQVRLDMVLVAFIAPPGLPSLSLLGCIHRVQVLALFGRSSDIMAATQARSVACVGVQFN